MQTSPSSKLQCKPTNIMLDDLCGYGAQPVPAEVQTDAATGSSHARICDHGSHNTTMAKVYVYLQSMRSLAARNSVSNSQTERSKLTGLVLAAMRPGGGLPKSRGAAPWHRASSPSSCQRCHHPHRRQLPSGGPSCQGICRLPLGWLLLGQLLYQAPLQPLQLLLPA